MRHVVMWSSGITSWAVAKLVLGQYGPADIVCLFADTKAEDEDNYRFNQEASALLGVQLTIVADGRDPQQVNRDTRWLSNSRAAKCSELLKIIPSRQWLEANCDPADTVLYLGLDWTEPERVETNRAKWAPWHVEFPLTAPPYRSKDHWIAECRRMGVMEPEMYRLGFAHANCGGACVRAGQAQWAHLLDVRGCDSRYNPDRFADRFASWERHEQEMNELTRTAEDSPVSMVRDRRGGTTIPLPLVEIRRLHDEQPTLIDPYDIGGCGCFTDGGAA